MKGVFNSEIDPRADFSSGSGVSQGIWHALEDDVYLVGMLCTHLVRNYKFKPDESRFARLTPEYVASILNAASVDLDAAIFALLEEKTKEIETNLFERKMELVEVKLEEADDKQTETEV